MGATGYLFNLLAQPTSQLCIGPRAGRRPRRGAGFSLVELLVSIGIITLLMSLLLPVIRKAHDRAKWVNCQSNLRQVGIHLVMYSQQYKGWLYPVGPPTLGSNGLPGTLGADKPRDERWPVFVFDPPAWNPPILTCPSDSMPVEEHSYILNQHLADHYITFSSGNRGGLTYSDVVVAGEKITTEPDYYMERQEFDRIVEPWRHGLHYGSNYLYLDMHVTTDPPGLAKHGLDPWDPPELPTTRPTGT